MELSTLNAPDRSDDSAHFTDSSIFLFGAANHQSHPRIPLNSNQVSVFKTCCSSNLAAAAQVSSAKGPAADVIGAANGDTAADRLTNHQLFHDPGTRNVHSRSLSSTPTSIAANSATSRSDRVVDRCHDVGTHCGVSLVRQAGQGVFRYSIEQRSRREPRNNSASNGVVLVQQESETIPDIQ
jgi:hypothetical protein